MNFHEKVYFLVNAGWEHDGNGIYIKKVRLLLDGILYHHSTAMTSDFIDATENVRLFNYVTNKRSIEAIMKQYEKECD
ncbi:hypothetical protein EG878_14725 [Enterococcus faecalis]|nr:hypothetical protein EG878_14725 [Enterococcus faecalis]